MGQERVFTLNVWRCSLCVRVCVCSGRMKEAGMFAGGPGVRSSSKTKMTVSGTNLSCDDMLFLMCTFLCC